MAKRQRKPTPAIKRQTSNDKILGATVTTSDRSSAKFKRTDARELARRVQQFVLFCGMFNATNCASQKMRLYRKAGARGSRAWAGKQITDRKRLKYLYNPQRGSGPGLKAAQFAMESAGIEEVPQHPSLDLLNNSNPYQRGTTFAKQCWLQWEFFGRRAVHIVQPQSDAPSELYIMYADRVRPIPDAKLFVSGYVYGRDTTVERVFTPDEVLWQVWCPHPFDPYGALCPLHSVFAEADLYGAYSESELAMMRNGARPDFGVKVSTDTTDIQLKQMRESIEQRHRGPQHRGEFFIFRDADFVPLNFSNKEMENLLGRQDIRSTIGAAYGIPETFWRMNDANLAGSQTAQEFYFRMTIAPRLAQDAEEWSETLLPRYGIDPGEYWFAYDDCVPENKAEIRSDIQTYVMLGILDVEEARAELGYGERKQTDRDDAEDEKPEADKPGEKSVRHLDHSCNDHKAVEPSSAAQIQMESIVRGWLNQLATALHLPKDESKMIDSIPKQVAKYVPQLASSLVTPLRTLLGQGIVEGGVEIGQTIADPFALYPDHAVQFVNQYSIRLSDSTAKTTTENVQRTVRAGIEQSLSYNDLAASVRTQLHDEAPWRATMIARTESVRANNYGKIETYKKYGYTDIRWKLGPGACPACTAFVEKFGYETEIGTPFAPIDAKFTDTQGNVVVLDYEAIYAPPLHPNCRCYIEPVLKKTADTMPGESGAMP